MSFILLSTYRFQFNYQFTFEQGTNLVDYLDKLGISHYYSSSILRAKEKSLHGYDVVDHTAINPEIGTEEDFKCLVDKLHQRNMGFILDIVPNHMLILDANNKWWMDILENGRTSPYAEYFDIDWNPPYKELKNKVLLPILDQQFGNALENQVLKIIYKEGSFFLQLPSIILPTDPKTWNLILTDLVKEAEKVKIESDHLLELQSIVTAIQHMPTSIQLEKEKITERLREKEIIKKRLSTLFSKSLQLRKILDQQLQLFNGRKEEPSSFSQLEDFLDVQNYRLSFWRVANAEINYRRFFEILELAAIRSEDPKVFEAVHQLIFEFIKKRYIDGLRIDHIDGLRDPTKYLIQLQKKYQEIFPESNSFYVIAEKILTGNEKLPIEWELEGTVGYDFLNYANGLYVVQQNKKPLQDIYRNFTGIHGSVFEIIYQSKELILQVSMSSELHVLARHLDTISEQHRSSRDFTHESLKSALKDVIASFPVYRSYIQAQEGIIHEEDKQYIHTAIARSKRVNPAINSTIFDFIQSILLLEYPQGINEIDLSERQDFVMRFQQVTSPVMAKGLEDTTFYRYYPLVSINEVGADIALFGTSTETFHKRNLERLEQWPNTLNASSTHDTKRSEDARARINVLSEIPELWDKAIQRWKDLNAKHKKLYDEESIPDSNEEYLLYQTLIGTWPFPPVSTEIHSQYIEKITAYMEKAIKEAKINSSWINPNKAWDEGVLNFIKKVLDRKENSSFINDFEAFLKPIIDAGMLNSLSQLIMKMMSPGIPDIYQGNEIWEFNLVDPDNRRPIDYSIRIKLLDTIESHLKNPSPKIVLEMLKNFADGRIKLYITSILLRLRKRYPKLFLEGQYLPLEIQGDKKNNLVAFARKFENQVVIVVTERFFYPMVNEGITFSFENWESALISHFEKREFTNVFTNEKVYADSGLGLKKMFSIIPFAVLISN